MMHRSLGLAIFAATLAIWELSVRNGLISQRFLASPSQIAVALTKILADGDVRAGIATTLFELLLAMIVALPAGALLGFFLGENQLAHRLFAPILSGLMVTPKAVFLPLFILALGVGVDQKVVFGIFQAFFVIAVATVAATHGVPNGLLLVARSQRASRLQTYRHIYLPYMLPVVVQAVRIGVIYALHGILLAEIYVSRVGLGRLLLIWGNAGQTADLLAGASLAGLMAILINEGFRLYEHRVGVWRT
jgi:ABC-type nitrate/sulfonate/bicarbonate transport system permease component